MSDHRKVLKHYGNLFFCSELRNSCLYRNSKNRILSKRKNENKKQLKYNDNNIDNEKRK